MVIFFVNILIIMFFYNSVISEDGKTFSQSEKTEIVIIGTVHESTVNFNSDTLLSIFDKFKPDVILLETDTSYFENDFSLKEDIAYMFPETRAVSGYIKENEVKLRPFDINGRDLFLDDQKRLYYQNGFFNEIENLYVNGSYNETAGKIYSGINNMMKTADELANSTLSYMNSREGSLKIDTINYYTYEGLEKLITETPELSGYRSYWKEEYEFWNKRNETMVSNILRISNLFKGRKILVMCGFAHKNILLTELINRSEEYDLVIKTLNDI